MNHDVLRNALFSTVMMVYKSLYDEYKNEDKAKRETLKLAKDVLVSLGLRGDIHKTYESLLYQYSQCSDEKKKYELYKKLEVLKNAIDIIKEVDPLGR